MADQTNDAVSDERLRELLPCPFCGGEPKMHHINFGYSSLNAGRDGYRVECTECSAMQPAYDLVEAEAIAAWNRRSVTSQASEGEVVAYRVRHKGDERWALTFTDPRVTPSGAINDEIEAEPLGLITEGLVTPPYSRGIEAALVKGDGASASSPVASPSKRVERLEVALKDAREARKTAIDDAALIAKYGMDRAQRDYRTESPHSDAYRMAEEIYEAIQALQGGRS